MLCGQLSFHPSMITVQKEPIDKKNNKVCKTLQMPKTKNLSSNLISQVICIHQVPLASALFITPPIAFSWKVDPFRMAKLHKSFSKKTIKRNLETTKLAEGIMGMYI